MMKYAVCLLWMICLQLEVFAQQGTSTDTTSTNTPPSSNLPTSPPTSKGDTNKTSKGWIQRGGEIMTNIQDTVTQDWANMNAWEYKIECSHITVTNLLRLQATMNLSGKDKWECIAATPTADGLVLIYKRPLPSVLKQIQKLR